MSFTDMDRGATTMQDYFEQVLQPTDKPTTAKRVVTALWLSVLLVEFTVWLLVGIIGGFDGPWWLWTAAVGGVVVGCLHLVGREPREHP
ncbi:hypothetical protein [Actinophytocola oryzae]|uniref:DUF2530 domain-containing protein n=1 Tax=Actinophytocola oryzae TaxID=502181 RepID=A0A4R7V9K9_9PSEU|nr:hypothetical protein [Actinophytocola oryzae]TDV45618.1 hypothetical protein CLV71_112290 [Actinophytocola oryzae]